MKTTENDDDDDDDESEVEEKSQYGLEELGIAFAGNLNATQERYKDKLASKLQKVSRFACGSAAIARVSRPCSQLRTFGIDRCYCYFRMLPARLEPSFPMSCTCIRCSGAIPTPQTPYEQEQEAEARSQEARSGQFNLAKAAYERGRYAESVKLFEAAIEKEGVMSALVNATFFRCTNAALCCAQMYDAGTLIMGLCP